MRPNLTPSTLLAFALAVLAVAAACLADPDREECRCLGGMVLDDNGGCKLQGDPPGGGEPVTSVGGSIRNPGETDPDDKKLNVTLRCRPGEPPPGTMIECVAKPRNAEGSVVYKWRFAPDPERVPVRDGMTGPVLPRVEVPATGDSVWGGTGSFTTMCTATSARRALRPCCGSRGDRRSS